MFLSGGREFLAEHRPIIYGEFNSYYLGRFGQSLVDVVEIVSPLEYRFFRWNRQAAGFALVDPKVGLEDVLLVPVGTPRCVLAGLGILGA